MWCKTLGAPCGHLRDSFWIHALSSSMLYQASCSMIHSLFGFTIRDVPRFHATVLWIVDRMFLDRGSTSLHTCRVYRMRSTSAKFTLRSRKPSRRRGMLGTHKHRGSCGEWWARVADPEIETLRRTACNGRGSTEELTINSLQASQDDAVGQVVLLGCLNESTGVGAATRNNERVSYSPPYYQ